MRIKKPKGKKEARSKRSPPKIAEKRGRKPEKKKLKRDTKRKTKLKETKLLSKKKSKRIEIIKIKYLKNEFIEKN